MTPPSAPAEPPPHGRWAAWLARGVLLSLTATGVALTVGGMLTHHRTGPRDWLGFAIALILASAAAWILVRPGRSTRIVCLAFLGVVMAGAPFLDAPYGVIRLDGFVLVNLAILWVIVPRLGLALRRYLRWILLGVGLYLVFLSYALAVRDDWRRYHSTEAEVQAP